VCEKEGGPHLLPKRHFFQHIASNSGMSVEKLLIGKV